ncbi:MAG: tail fiber domain-containing protein [Minisyncoccia bacterium]
MPSRRRFSTLPTLVLILSLAPLAAQAALYAPGATLDPACGPTDPNCGVATTTISGTITMNGSIIPSVANTYSLGTAQNTWKDVYVGPGSLYVNGQEVLYTDPSHNVNVSADVNQDLILQTSGTGDIQLNPSGTGGLILLKGNVQLSAGKTLRSSDGTPLQFSDGIQAGNLALQANKLAAANTNGSLEFASLGLGAVYVSHGNFGIGTTSPLAALAVSGGASIGSDYNFAAPSNSLIVEGLVGIGTTSPSQSLSVNGRVYSSGGFQFPDGTIQTTAAFGGGATSTLLSDSNTFSGLDSFTNASSNFAGTWQGKALSYFQTALGYTPYNATNPNNYIPLTALSAGTGISYNNTTGQITNTGITSNTGNWAGTWQTYSPASFQPAGAYATFGYPFPSGATTTALTIDGATFAAGSTGNVGIGTTSPTSPLQIGVDSFTTPDLLIGSGANVGNFISLSGNRGIIGVNPSSGQFSLTAGSGKAFAFYVNSTNAPETGTQALIVQSNGNVGIGNTSPSYKLDVSGFINTDQYSGYNQAGNTVLYASTTNNSLAIGASQAAAWMSASSTQWYSVAIGSGALATTPTSAGAQYNTAEGYQDLNHNTTGSYNSAQGANALYNNTTGSYNSAQGYKALYYNTTGSYNSAQGFYALQNNTTGSNNSAQGNSALHSNTTGSNNSAQGQAALYSNTSGNQNSAQGANSLSSNTTGSYNSAQGNSALYSNTTGNYNFGLGYQAGYGDGTNADNRSVIDNYMTFIGTYSSRDASVASTTALSKSIAIGYNAKVGCSNCLVLGGTGADAVNVGIGNVSPSYPLDVSGFINTDQYSGYKQAGNTVLYASTTNNSLAIGASSAAAWMAASSTNWYSVAIGSGALATTPTNASAQYNTAEGYQALNHNTTGSNNSAQGYKALNANTTGYNNSAQGLNALLSNTTGSWNVAQGVNSLSHNTTGSNNSAQGYQALYFNTTGQQNSAQGVSALYANTTGSYNSAQGKGALYSNTTGSYNSAQGFNALSSNTTGSYNFGLGYQAGYGDGSNADNQSVIDNYMTFIGTYSSRDASVASTTALSKSTAIGYNAKVGCSNCLVLGGTGADAVNVGIGTTTPYARLMVWGPDTASTSAFAIVNSASTTVFSIFDNGNATYSGSIFQSSDARLKSNVTPLDASSSLAAINGLTPVSYNRLDQNDSGTNLGFIAQAVQSVFPELVSTTSPTVLTPGGTLTVNYVGLIAPLVKAVQALSGQVSALASTVTGFAQSFTSQNITAKQQLCVGDTCVTESQLKTLLQNAGQGSGQSAAAAAAAAGSASGNSQDAAAGQIKVDSASSTEQQTPADSTATSAPVTGTTTSLDIISQTDSSVSNTTN